MKTKNELIKDYNLGLITEQGYLEGVYHCTSRVIEINQDYVFGYYHFSGEPKKFFKVKLHCDYEKDTFYFFINKSKFTTNEVIRLNL